MNEQPNHATETAYVRRPLKRVSRKKWAEAIRCLKGAMACETLSWKSRLRSCELYMVIMGEEIGLPNARDRKSVKALVSENSFEKQLQAQVREGVLSQVGREAKAEAKRYLEEQAEAEAKAAAEAQAEVKEAIAYMRSQMPMAEA